MTRSIIEKIVGIFFLAGAIFCAYLAFAAQNNSTLLVTFSLCVLAFCAIGILLFSHSKRLDKKSQQTSLLDADAPSYAPTESMIEKQNDLLSEWNDTNNKRDKLKMLKLSAAAQNDSN